MYVSIKKGNHMVMELSSQTIYGGLIIIIAQITCKQVIRDRNSFWVGANISSFGTTKTGVYDSGLTQPLNQVGINNYSGDSLYSMTMLANGQIPSKYRIAVLFKNGLCDLTRLSTCC